MTAHLGHHKNSSLTPPHSGIDWSMLYEYTADLLTLDFCRPILEHRVATLHPISTPLRVDAWRAALEPHPDQALARYITTGLTTGFRVGFKYGSPLRSSTANMQSANLHPEVITAYLQKEISLGRMLGPFPSPDGLPQLHINRFGVIPKGHQTGKWRLITDLSYPAGASVNDGIDPTICSLSYTTIDDIAHLLSQYGPGALLAKIDIESAYRLIPVHPQDRPLQTMAWQGQLYIDPMLPFGLRSAPKIFNAVADALQWHLQRSGIPLIRHYLDDFIIIAPAQSPRCEEYLSILNRECTALGIPIADHKRDGPTTCLTFLGIEVDTIAGELRLPSDKMQRLKQLLLEWGNKKSCRRKELESLIGLLNHACKVVRPGRSFLRRMIDLLHAIHHPHNSTTPIRLNRGFRSDLAWWHQFVQQWNGVSFLSPPSHLPSLEMTSDASGSWGCGAWHNSSWFQLGWDERAHPLSIAEKELIPIILGCATWGNTWRACQVLCHCDNQAIVACLRSRTSKQKGIMHLLRCLVYIEAIHSFHLTSVYIDTKSNFLADDLSRNNLSSFLSKAPHADRYPTPVSSTLLDLLLDPQAEWTSPTWRPRFSDIFRRV